MTAASTLTVWHFGFTLAATAAIVALYAARDWHPRNPGHQAIDDIEAEL